jgi:hypothetical protein
LDATRRSKSHSSSWRRQQSDRRRPSGAKMKRRQISGRWPSALAQAKRDNGGGGRLTGMASDTPNSVANSLAWVSRF